MKRVDFALILKVAIDIRGASVMLVRRMCISTLWSSQNQCRAILYKGHYTEILSCKEQPPFDSF